MIPINRPFKAELDSAFYQNIEAYADHLGVEMSEPLKAELAHFVYRCELAIERRAKEASLNPPPFIIGKNGPILPPIKRTT